MDPVTTTAIGVAGSAASGLVNQAFNGPKRQYKYWEKSMEKANDYQKMAEQRQFQYNKDLQDYAFQKNLEQWQLENAYNTPEAQMARYRAAGLNANLIYGQSNMSAGSPQMSVGDVGTSAPTGASMTPTANFDLVSGANLGAQYDLQKKALESNIALQSAETAGKLIENEVSEGTKESLIKTVEENLKKVTSENENIITDTEKKRQETALAHQQMIKTKYETRFAKYHANIENLLYQKEKAHSPYYEQNAEYDNKIKRAELAFRTREIRRLDQEYKYMDKKQLNELQIQALEIIGLTQDATQSEIDTRIKQILEDPDVDSDNYWSTLFLQWSRNFIGNMSFGLSGSASKSFGKK